MRKVVILLLSAFLATALVASAAIAATQTIEAESFVLGGSHNTISDSSYSGGKGLKINDNSGVSYADNVTTEANTDVVVYAESGTSGGFASLQLVVDGSNVGSAVQLTGDLASYNIDANISAGTHDIGFKGVNTATGRNVKIDKMDVVGGGGTAPTDTDGDGVPDSEDQCDNQPGPASNGGCPVTQPTDTDGDGVPDSEDQCDSQPGPASNNGCPVSTSNTWPWNNSGADVVISPGDNFAAKVNGAQAGSLISVEAGGYTASAEMRPNANVTITGEPGTYTLVGDARDPDPTVHVNCNGVAKCIAPKGQFTMRGIHLFNADATPDGSKVVPGTGSLLPLGDTSHQNLFEYVELNDAGGAASTSFEGTMRYSEVYDAGNDKAALGQIGAAIKADTEHEVAYSYIHDNQANGLWCDNGCSEVSNTIHPNGAWWHHNTIVGQGRYGFRFEEAPDIGAGDHPEHLAEFNRVAENGFPAFSGESNRAGSSARDVADVLIRNNIFGPQSITGLGTVGHNADNRAVEATDSGRSDRPNLADVRITNNDLNGEVIHRCGGVVTCSGNFN